MILTPPRVYTFSSDSRILKSSLFQEVRKRGRRFFTKSFIIYTLPNGISKNRLGITASARVGNSVKRNRVKRLLREFFRLNTKHISTGSAVDVAVYVKRNINIDSLNLGSVESELEKILIKKIKK